MNIEKRFLDLRLFVQETSIALGRFVLSQIGSQKFLKNGPKAGNMFLRIYKKHKD